MRWHPFQLNPDLPAEGIDRADYLKMKFGDRAGGNMYDNVRRAAADVGLDLAMDDIERQPNTIRAHSLIALAQQHNQQKMVETLFEAYFQKGVDLTSEQSLIETAREAGLAEPLIEAALNDESVHETVRAADANARQLGVSGVPFFIFNQRLAVSGAAGAETLVQAFRKASEPANDAEVNSPD
ncbi:MAG: DsbA family oxidoreductase [Burkholderiaceae bacterium]